MTKFCGRCTKPIRNSETYTTHEIPAATAGGTTVYLHAKPCQPVPTQTTQVSAWRGEPPFPLAPPPPGGGGTGPFPG